MSDLWIETDEDLNSFCKHLESQNIISLDTEFAMERRYYPRFDLLQIGTKEHNAAIDVHSKIDLKPLVDILAQKERVVIIHACLQDILILHKKTGIWLENVFDTQIAMGFLGYGTHLSYAFVVKKIMGITLSKLETMTDWRHRPLRKEQLTYAYDDVKYLPEIYEKIIDDLNKTERMDWYKSEIKRFLDNSKPKESDILDKWKKNPAIYDLSFVQVAIFRELLVWREHYAMSKDTPAKMLIPDDVLLQISKKQPNDVSSLRHFRQLFEKTIQTLGQSVIYAVKRGQKADLLEIELFFKQKKEAIPGLNQLLDTILHAIAKKLSISVNILAPSGELEQFALDFINKKETTSIIAQGWRYEHLGKIVESIISGNSFISFNILNKELEIIQR